MSPTTRATRALAIGALAALAACVEQPTQPVDGPEFAVVAQSPIAAQIAGMMNAMNAGFAAEGTPYRVALAEYLTDAGGQEAGLTVLAKDVGNRRLSFDFVPHDPRREWSGPVGGGTDDITYAVDQTGDAVPVLGGLGAAATDAAIDRAMASWDMLTCSELAITRNDDFGLDIGLVAFLDGLGGSPFVFADVQHAGWRDIDFAGNVLGVTFTFGFTDGAGNFTDIDGNGYADAAFREIYYDPTFPWADDGTSDVDVESVAVHEAGHGLSQGHFGQVALKNDGSLTASPRAVMNALYAAPFRQLAGNDVGGHCNNWASWR
jgi:hypothetical protein